MKFIHTSDIHLDSPLNTRLSSSKIRQRKREILESFRKMIYEAIRTRTDAIIIGGDLFDNESVSVETVDSVLGMIENAKDVVFFYLPGNHEKNRVMSLGIAIPENLKIFSNEWTYFNLGSVTIAGRSSTDVNMFSDLHLDAQRRNILVLHGEMRDKSDKDGKIGVRELAELPVDYVALGHYHSYRETKISSRCTAVYSGTPEGRGFDETGDKGYVLVDVDSFGAIHKFVKRATRSLHIIPVDITYASRTIDIENLVAEELANTSSLDLVRILLFGERMPGLKRDTEAITKRFESSCYYLEVKDDTRLKISMDDYVNDKSLKGEFIRLVLEKQELTEEEKSLIIECGLRALAGEEIS